MATYLTPGVYRRPAPAPPPPLERVRTDVAGFAGIAERGPLPSPDPTAEARPEHVAIRVTSWQEYLATFGGYIRHGNLAYSVRAFFENGGDACWIVRVAATHHANLSMRPRAAWFKLPSGPGVVSAATTEDAAEGSALLKVDSIARLSHRDVIEIEGGGVRVVTAISEVRADALALARPLRGAMPKGAVVKRLPPALTIRAVTAGNWGGRIQLFLTPLEAGTPFSRFALRVRVAPGPDPTLAPEEEFYRRLSLEENQPDFPFAEDAINGASKLIRVEVHAPRVEPLPEPVWLEGGRDGLKGLTIEDFTGTLDSLRGARLFEEIDEVAILCSPDAVFEGPSPEPHAPPEEIPCEPPPPARPPAPEAMDPTAVPDPAPPGFAALIQQRLLDQCERLRDRVAILDTPDHLGVNQAVAWRRQFTSRFGALYYPWIRVPNPLQSNGATRRIPPSGHAAGVYARTDRQFGVQRPPAGFEIEFVNDVAEEISSLDQERLNPHAVNAIRSFPGRGIRVWGARSLAADAEPEWRFIHVRRLMSMIEESVEDASQWVVFENHTQALRRTLVHSLNVFLETIWRQGGMKGDQPEQGFYVKCDETNNPPPIVDRGQLICEVGVAAAAPMEFLVFELRLQPSGAEYVER